MNFTPNLALDDAEHAITAAIEAATAARAKVSIAVVDAAGGLLAFRRMDGARAFTVDIAMRKARTAAAVGASTAAIGKAMGDRPALPDMMTLPGGIPLLHQRDAAGAIGVSGASVEIDETVATAGSNALQARLAAPA